MDLVLVVTSVHFHVSQILAPSAMPLRHGGRKWLEMNQRIMRRPEVESTTGLSRSLIYAKMSEGTFPLPVRLGKRAVGWPESRVNDWLASLADRNAE